MVVPAHQRAHLASEEQDSEDDAGSEEDPDLGELPDAGEEEEGIVGAASGGRLHLGRRVRQAGTLARAKRFARCSARGRRHRCRGPATARQCDVSDSHERGHGRHSMKQTRAEVPVKDPTETDQISEVAADRSLAVA